MNDRLVCKGCAEIFFRRSTRGKIPRFCDECRANPQKMQAANEIKPELPANVDAQERVDRLEIALKASNLHISQWRDEYE